MLVDPRDGFIPAGAACSRALYSRFVTSSPLSALLTSCIFFNRCHEFFFFYHELLRTSTDLGEERLFVDSDVSHRYDFLTLGNPAFENLRGLMSHEISYLHTSVHFVKSWGF